MIYIVVRQTTDWADEATFRAQIPDRVRPAIELWNATFSMPYHVFRRELTRIARLNWSRIPGATLVPRAEVPENAVVLPTDDDDWFSPRIGAALAAHVDADHVGYYWPSAFLEVPISLRHRLGRLRRTIFPRTPSTWLCTTNNYALVLGADTQSLIDNHMQASEWFVTHPLAVKKLDEQLSVMNRTLASMTSLWSNPSRADLIRKLRRYRRLYRKRLAVELSWCEPYAAMMRDLMEAVELSQ